MIKNKKFFEYNFLPNKERRKRENKKFALVLFFDIGLSILIIFTFFYFLNPTLAKPNLDKFLKKFQKEYKKLKEENILLNEKIKYYRELISICKKQKIIKSINLTLLENIEKYTLDNLSLTNLKYKENFFILKGISSNPKYIYIFLNNLKKFYKLTGFQIKPSKKLYKFKAEFFIIPSL